MRIRLILSYLMLVLFSFMTTSSAFTQIGKGGYYHVIRSKLPFDSLPGTQTKTYWGVLGGAGYRMEVPKNWNGELVLYAHGYRGVGPDLYVSNPRIRKYFVTHGFAWAASSYNKNGYNVTAGVEGTHALGKLFAKRIKKPKRTYVIGHSMGGNITGALIEQYPDEYDGALPMCGVMGDYRLFDYFVSYNLVAQTLAGVKEGFPPSHNYQARAVPRMREELGLNGQAQLTAKGKELRAVTMNLSGGKRPLFDLGFQKWSNFLFTLYTPESILGVKPGSYFSNANTTYQLDENPAVSPKERKLNDSVLRVGTRAKAGQLNGISDILHINGNIHMPVITMHTLGDLFVPFSMEQIYARKVAAQGRSNLLVTRAIRDVRHCGFTNQEIQTGFADLVKWVEKGKKPQGDNILSPKAVSNPNFGTRFTSELRPYDLLNREGNPEHDKNGQKESHNRSP